MDKKHKFANIDKEEFYTLLEQYPNIITNPKLKALETQRLETVPAAVRARKDAHLKKSELVVLMDWKLSHGKFRPSLQKLVQENSDMAVLAATGSGFKLASYEPRVGLPGAAIKKLCELRGVGPATASLLLTTYKPEVFPFFSDELYRWAFWSEGTGNGWDRKMQYNDKEYLALYSKMEHLRKRLSVSNLEAEKVAYVLGKATYGAVPASSKPTAQPKKRKAETAQESPEPEPEPKRQAKTTEKSEDKIEAEAPEKTGVANKSEKNSTPARKRTNKSKALAQDASTVRRSTRNRRAPS